MKYVLFVVLGMIAFVFSVIVLYFLITAISALLVNKNKIYEKFSPYYWKLLLSASWICKAFMRVKVTVNGKEKMEAAIPKGGRFLLISNHRSNFDPILTWFELRDYPMSFVSKEDNLHIPFYGRIIRRCLFLSIDRENPRNAMKTIQKASELILDNQTSYGIYPEGTRNKECEKGLLPFHNGVIKIAQRAKVPLVIMTIDGVEKVSNNFPKHGTKVTMDILEVIPAEELAHKKTAEIGDYAKELMEKHLYHKD